MCCLLLCVCVAGDDEVMRFVGNDTHDEHFKLVLHDSSGSLLVGGRNVIYNISVSDLQEQNRVEWHPNAAQMKSCYMKGGSEEVCQNYVRILKEKAPGHFLICGTNAYNPMCRDFTLSGGVLEREREYPGRGLCPFDPSHNSTAVFADGQLYVGTIADFAGLEPLIYREPLRTEQYDLSTLNSPNFVSSFALGDFVYFFFREIAVEYLNCGKTLYSRVARVCRHDKGGPHKFRNKWTSYLKSRLNCSVSGDFPFYFNEIQATTEAVEGRYGGHATTLLYGVFTTPENSIPGSAVCAFTFQDIMDTFEGPFKGQTSVNANWLPVQSTKVPEPRPGQCVKDSSTLPDVTLNFIKLHSLMDEAVPAFFGKPIIISTSFHYSGRFTSIAVDPQVRTPDGKAYDVLFIGTDDGKVIKAVNTKSADSYQEVDPFIIEEIDVFPSHIAVTSLQVIKPRGKPPRLLVGSRSMIHSISLNRCYTDKSVSCSDCVALQDPYCAWDKTNRKCRMLGIGKEMIQNISDGVHSDCGKPDKKSKPSHSAASVTLGTSGTSLPVAPKDDRDHKPTSTEGVPLHFTAETLAIAVASATIGALILGFITGFFCGKKCNKDEDNQLYADTDYEYFDQRQNANSRLTGELQEEVTYAEPVLVPQALNKPVNLVLNMSPKATLKTPGSNTPGGNVGTVGAPMGPSLGLPTTGVSAGPHDIPLHYTPESYSTHGTLRSSEKYGTRGRDHRPRDYDHRLVDGYSTTRSVKKVYL
ncbi:semaphorin-1A-like isoform X2 [Homarus americanus]|uniref:semaphorin-1A-like isoform X2 n=1 Tax=Homarus americanus TaxID=6706 RepID=UPI001C4508BA|nr:semaphorin-1A-like isoform X2 [Homarus americanus]